MKNKLFLLFLCLTIVFSLVGCQKTLKGTDELIEKAREELPVSDADTIDVQFAGMCAEDDKALMWFISGNEYQNHYYLPMECNIVGENEYTFGRTFNVVMDRGDDIRVLEWQGGYCFLVNNPNCRTIKITGNVGGIGNATEVVIEKDAYPYLYYYGLLPTEYIFLDSEGNEL